MRSIASHAFTLAELLVAILIVALIMAGLGSAVLISSQALPSNTEVQSIRMDTTNLLDQIDSELAYATNVPERSVNAIAFAVPDRDGDGNAERIRYAYDAKTRTITREYRGSSAQVVLNEVDSFAIAYSYATARESYDGLSVEDAAETLLSINSSSAGQHAIALSNANWPGQLISPTLPGDAVSWRITRVQVLAARTRTNAANIRARVYPALAGGTPENQYLEDQVFSSSLLSAIGSLPFITIYSTFEIAFSGAHGFDVSDNACVVLSQLSGGDGTLQLLGADGTGKLTGIASNWNWTLSSTMGMNHACYARISRRGAETGFDRNYLTHVRMNIQTGAETAVRVADTLPLNRPEALSRKLNLDFSELPLKVDTDGDAQPDWTLVSGAEKDVESSGVLTSAVVLGATPDTEVKSNSIIEIGFRATQVGGAGDALRIVTEADDTTGAAFFVSATLNADRTQTLQILDEKRNVLHKVRDLPESMIDVRIVFDSTLDALSVSVGGRRANTFPLTRTSLSFGGPTIQVGRLRDPVEIDYVCLHIQ